MNDKLQQILDSVIQLEYVNDYLLVLKEGSFGNPNIRILVISMPEDIIIKFFTQDRMDEIRTASVRVANAMIMDFIDEQLAIMYADL